MTFRGPGLSRINLEINSFNSTISRCRRGTICCIRVRKAEAPAKIAKRPSSRSRDILTMAGSQSVRLVCLSPSLPPTLPLSLSLSLISRVGNKIHDVPGEQWPFFRRARREGTHPPQDSDFAGSLSLSLLFLRARARQVMASLLVLTTT